MLSLSPLHAQSRDASTVKGMKTLNWKTVSAANILLFILAVFVAVSNPKIFIFLFMYLAYKVISKTDNTLTKATGSLRSDNSSPAAVEPKKPSVLGRAASRSLDKRATTKPRRAALKTIRALTK